MKLCSLRDIIAPVLLASGLVALAYGRVGDALTLCFFQRTFNGTHTIGTQLQTTPSAPLLRSASSFVSPTTIAITLYRLIIASEKLIRHLYIG